MGQSGLRLNKLFAQKIRLQYKMISDNFLSLKQCDKSARSQCIDDFYLKRISNMYKIIVATGQNRYIGCHILLLFKTLVWTVVQRLLIVGAQIPLKMMPCLLEFLSYSYVYFGFINQCDFLRYIVITIRLICIYVRCQMVYTNFGLF